MPTENLHHNRAILSRFLGALGLIAIVLCVVAPNVTKVLKRNELPPFNFVYELPPGYSFVLPSYPTANESDKADRLPLAAPTTRSGGVFECLGPEDPRCKKQAMWPPCTLEAHCRGV